ncbi:hypothetical protein C8A06_1058 [Microbacteriaceae bacterium MWH-Ta3]|nr:hypothetical protein C8A06_1058 [Microbacteriaceae bacterium MWH-Ta3]
MPKNWVATIAALVGGAMIAAIITVVHQEAAPWILIAGLLVVAVYLLGLRWVTDDRWPTYAGAAGILVTVYVLAQESAGGSILIPGNEFGTWWVYGSAAIALVIVLWPRVTFRAAR